MVRGGKGDKDRRTVLPGRLVEPLQQHLKHRNGYGNGFSPSSIVGETDKLAPRDGTT
jgi:hypothetical protein